MTLEEYYSKLAKKKNLPSYKELNAEFNIESIREPNYLRRISEKIADKAQAYRETLERFINPSTSSIRELTELDSLSEDYKERAMNCYSHLCLIERKFLLADLENTDFAMITFIRKAFYLWKELKPELINMVKSIVKSWHSDVPLKHELEKLGYLG